MKSLFRLAFAIWKPHHTQESQSAKDLVEDFLYRSIQCVDLVVEIEQLWWQPSDTHRHIHGSGMQLLARQSNAMGDLDRRMSNRNQPAIDQRRDFSELDGFLSKDRPQLLLESDLGDVVWIMQFPWFNITNGNVSTTEESRKRKILLPKCPYKLLLAAGLDSEKFCQGIVWKSEQTGCPSTKSN